MKLTRSQRTFLVLEKRAAAAIHPVVDAQPQAIGRSASIIY